MPGDVAPRPIAWTGAVIIGTVVAAVIAVLLLLHSWGTAPGANRVDMPDPVAVPGPALQSAPQTDLRQYRQEKERQLQGTGWVDAPNGIAHIPIADAMALLAASAAGGQR